MKQMKKRMLSAVALILSVLMLCASFAGCSKAPEYAEIEERFRELVEASYEVNEIFFGEGLPTYERVYDPWENMEILKQTDENGQVTGYVYYCSMVDETLGDILAYRTGYTQPVVYLQVLKVADESREAVYVSEESGLYYYAVDYTPSEYDFYYSEDDPLDYDYVRFDSEYGSVEELKALAETVYSEDYLSAIYSGLFDGVYSVDDEYVPGLSPRYYEYTDEDGDTYFMMSNEDHFHAAKNIFDFSTARIVRPKNANKVTVQLEYYPENDPSARDEMKITMVLQNGQWMLDSTTY